MYLCSVFGFFNLSLRSLVPCGDERGGSFAELLHDVWNQISADANVKDSHDRQPALD